jgi:hypothetical protein
MLQKTSDWTHRQCTFSHKLTLKMKSILKAVLHEAMEKANPTPSQRETLRGSAAASGIVVTIGSNSIRT